MSTVVYETDSGSKIACERAIRKLEKEFDEATELKQKLEELIDEVVQVAIELCPKDTGALASSIKKGSGAFQAEMPNTIIDAVISAGDDTIVNPKTGIPTSEYVHFVHDGHIFKGGMGMYLGVPFLVEALLYYEEEIYTLIDKCLASMAQDAGFNE